MKRRVKGPIRVMRIIARLNIGGPAVHVTLLTRGLNDERFHSLLVTGVIGEAEGDMGYLARDLGVTPILIPTLQREIAPLDDFRALIALIRLMRREGPHVVHTHTAKAGFIGRLAAFLSGVPVIVHTFHGHVFHGYFGSLKTRVFLLLERWAARLSSMVLTISPGLREELIDYRIAPPERIGVIPLGLDLSGLANLENLRGRFRREIGFSTDEVLIGIIGRLVSVKNHELFFEAARNVLAAVPGARFIVVGDGERRAELEDQAGRVGLSDRVVFTGWRRDLPAVYADLDVLVISSHNEGTPVSIIEALAAGVPVASTAVGGVPDLLKNGELGSLAPPGDAQALADAILTALEKGGSPDIQQARRWALSQYSDDRLIADIRTLYMDLLEKKGFAFD